jgi:hypothetical protein
MRLGLVHVRMGYRRSLALAAALSAALMATAGCGQVTPGAGTGPGSHSGPGPSPTQASPPYPFLEDRDYEYTLEIRCLCPAGGDPFRVRVKEGVAVSAVYLTGTPSRPAGESPSGWWWLTLNDIITAANDTEADEVTVEWPRGQQWPDRVGVNPDLNTLDEERAYVVSEVDLDP